MKKILLLSFLLVLFIDLAFGQDTLSAKKTDLYPNTTLKLKSNTYWAPISLLFFTSNRYWYGDERKKPAGMFGEYIKREVSSDPEALAHMKKYAQIRLAGVGLMWGVYPAMIIGGISYAKNASYEDNTPAYLVLGGTGVYLVGAILYHGVAKKHLKNAVIRFNRNRGLGFKTN